MNARPHAVCRPCRQYHLIAHSHVTMKIISIISTSFKSRMDRFNSPKNENYLHACVHCARSYVHTEYLFLLNCTILIRNIHWFRLFFSLFRLSAAFSSRKLWAMCQFRPGVLKVPRIWIRVVSHSEHHHHSDEISKQSYVVSTANSSQRDTVKGHINWSKLHSCWYFQVESRSPIELSNVLDFYLDFTFVARICWKMPSVVLCRRTKKTCNVAGWLCSGTQKKDSTMVDHRGNSSSSCLANCSILITDCSSIRLTIRTLFKFLRSRHLLTTVMTGEYSAHV